MISQSKLNRNIVALVIIIISVILIYASQNFQGAFLGAIVIFTLFLPIRNHLVDRRKIDRSVASLIVILLSLFTVIFPIFIFGSVLTHSIANFLAQNSAQIANAPAWFSDQVLKNQELVNREFFGTSVREIVNTGNINLSSALSNTTQFATNVLSSTAGIVAKGFVDIIIMYFVLYYLLRDKESIKRGLISFSPFNPENTNKLIAEFKGITYSSVLGMFAVAISQGVAVYIGIVLLNMIFKSHIPSPAVFGFLTGIGSLLPVVGAVIVWLPLGIYILLTNKILIGIIFIIYCMIVVSNVDNIIRAKVNESISKVHPLTSIVGIVICVPLFGIIGIVLGPLLISFLLLSVEMFKKEFVIPDQKGVKKDGDENIFLKD